MPLMEQKSQSPNDVSSLTNGWHPAYLLEITDEATPETWKMFAKSPRMYRWTFAVWETPAQMTMPPERQSAPSSQAFSPKGRNAASKAYLWTTELLGRQLLAGEAIDLDPMLPLPCRVKVTRNEQYANIVDLEQWRDAPELTPALKTLLRDTLIRDSLGINDAPQAPSRPAVPAPLQSYAAPKATTPPMPGKPRW